MLQYLLYKRRNQALRGAAETADLLHRDKPNNADTVITLTKHACMETCNVYNCRHMMRFINMKRRSTLNSHETQYIGHGDDWSILEMFLLKLTTWFCCLKLLLFYL